MKNFAVGALIVLPVVVLLLLSRPERTRPEPLRLPPRQTPRTAGTADAAWAEIEKVLPGPSEQPKSREEAIALMKAHLTKLDSMSAVFGASFPKDPRRWKLAMALVDSYRIRQIVGLPEKTLAEAKTALAEIMAAPDADAETKSVASYNTVVILAEETKGGKGTLDGLEKTIAAHRKAYPDFSGNAQLDRLIAVVKAESGIKGKPLDLKFKAVDGREVDIAAMRGKVVLVDFWATWCGPCVAEIPNVVKAYEKLHGKGFEIIGISFDQDKAKLESMTKEKGMPWPQFFDGKGWQNEFGQKYGINSIPQMWLVNKEGLVVDTTAREDLAKKVERLLGY